MTLVTCGGGAAMGELEVLLGELSQRREINVIVLTGGLPGYFRQSSPAGLCPEFSLGIVGFPKSTRKLEFDRPLTTKD